jgi:hypothetical protein
MDTANIISHIDTDVIRLTKARAILAGVTDTERLASVVVAAKPVKRKMSVVGKAKIAKAQKARWAEVRKAAKKTVQA